MNEPRISVTVAGINFPTPILSASGTFGFGEEFSKVYDLNSVLGGLVTKSLRLAPWPGNPPPRIWETPCGLLNSIGIPSDGYDHFVRVHVPFLQKLTIPIIVSIVGRNTEEYVELVKRLNTHTFVSAVELNLSCPNIESGGARLDDNKNRVLKIVKTVKDVARMPVFVKLSPASNIVERAICAEEGGADAVVVANTILGMAIDIVQRRPVFPNVFAGLSGPAVKPIILAMVWQVVGAVKVPVIACGGIVTGADALEYLMAGAKLVEVGTANLVDVNAIPRITKELQELLRERGISSIEEICGCARR